MKFTALTNLMTIRSEATGVFEHHRVKEMMGYIGSDINLIAAKVLEAEAEKLARMVKEEINFQPPNWPPLNQKYKEWKDKMGLNTDMLKATEAYWNAIAVQERRDSRGRYMSYNESYDSHFSFRVGLPFKKHPGMDDQDDDDQGIRYDQLASILEYGTEHVPARPHWGPAYRRWRSQHARSIKARIVSLAVRKFNSTMKKIKPKRATKNL